MSKEERKNRNEPLEAFDADESAEDLGSRHSSRRRFFLLVLIFGFGRIGWAAERRRWLQG